MTYDRMIETSPPLPKYDGRPEDCLYCTNTTTHPSCICSRCRNEFAELSDYNKDW